MDISMHGKANETAEANRIIDTEHLLEEGEAKCFVVMGSSAELAQVRKAKVLAVKAQIMEEDMVGAIEGVQSFWMEGCFDDYRDRNSDNWP